MIGATSRRSRGPRAGVWPGVLAGLLMGSILAGRAADPAEADPTTEAARHDRLTALAGRADAALSALQDELTAARHDGREGSALIVEGQEPAGPALERAASRLETAGSRADDAVAAVGALVGPLLAVRPEVTPPQAPPDALELRSIAAQLRDGGVAAEAFVERRHASERTLAHLEEALAALDRNAHDDALTALDEAAAALAVVADWDEAPATLPLWLETTGDLITAARSLTEAALAGDEEAVAAAAAAYGAAAEHARRADVSLALSMSEVGASLTATPMRLLADALAEAAAARATMASLLQAN